MVQKLLRSHEEWILSKMKLEVVSKMGQWHTLLADQITGLKSIGIHPEVGISTHTAKKWFR